MCMNMYVQVSVCAYYRTCSLTTYIKVHINIYKFARKRTYYSVCVCTYMTYMHVVRDVH